MRFFTLLVTGVLCAFCLWLGQGDRPIHVEPFQVGADPHPRLVGRLYTPASAPSPYPAVILCHGVSSSQDTMTPLAVELARHGMAAVTFDFGGSGASYPRAESPERNLTDVRQILAWVKQQTGLASTLDPQRLGIAGHSMGGTTALEMAKSSPEFRTTIILGIGGEASPNSPANLLFATGVYEELNPVQEMRAFLHGATGKNTPEFEQVGDFSAGTARSLILSSTADHAIAPYDPFLLAAAVKWAAQSFDLPASNLTLRVHWQMIAMVLGFFGAIALSVGIYQAWLPKIGRWIPGGLLVGCTIISYLFQPAITAHFLIGSASTILIAHYLYYYKQNTRSLLAGIFLYLILIYAAIMIALLLNAVLSGSLVIVPQAILGFPTLIARFLFFVLYNQFNSLRYFCFSAYGLFGLGSLMLFEMFEPGKTLKLLNSIAIGLIRLIRQPLSFRLQSASQSSTVLLAILLGLFCLILWQQGQSGLLSWEAIAFVGRLSLLFLILPTLLVVVAVRSPPFKTLEAIATVPAGDRPPAGHWQ